MADYTSQEYFDMLITYAEAGQSAYRAAIMYQEKFPGRRIPAHNVFVCFVRLASRAFTTDSLIPSCREMGAGRNRTAITPENVEAVLHAIDQDPTTSIRALS
ncbi:unnamed protein product [Lasius platythorax]|uniref:DUF4817 domain-containing protein n=1 Tax=Lasius platythorax TaxID=488582 RepID=A0AAV2MXM2_9HYME